MGKNRYYTFLVTAVVIIGIGIVIFNSCNNVQSLSLYTESVDQIKIMRREYVNFPIMKDDIKQYAVEYKEDSFHEILDIFKRSIFRRQLKRVKNVSLCGDVSYTIDLFGYNEDGAIHYTIIVDKSNMIYVSDSSNMGMICYKHEIELFDELQNVVSNLKRIE